MIGQHADLNAIAELEIFDVILTSELSAEMNLKEKSLPALYFHRYAQSAKVWSKIVASAREWLDTWHNREIYNGQSAVEFLKFEDTSLWWFVYDAIWETKGGVLDAIYHANALISLIEDYDPASIQLYGEFDFPIHEVFSSLSNKTRPFDLRLEKYAVTSGSDGTFSKPSGKLALLGRFLLLKAARILSRKTRNPSIAFFLDHGSKAVEKKLDGVKIIMDHYLEGLEEFLVHNRDRILLVSMNTPILSPSFMKNLIVDAKRVARGMYVPWMCYYSFSDLQKGMKLIRHYQSKITDLEGSPSFRDSMRIEGVDIYPLLRQVFRGTLARALALVHLEVEVGRRFLDAERSPLIFHLTGLSPTGRALCFACKKRNTNIVTPQLGITSTELPFNAAVFAGTGLDTRTLPHYLVYGPFYKQLFAGRGYPDYLIQAVGFWRTGRNNVKHSSLLPGYILYVAGANLGKLGYILSFDEEITTIRLIQKNIPVDSRLVVKLHPSLPYDLYNETLKDMVSSKAITLAGGPGTRGIEEFLAGANVVVSKTSTSLLQALIMNRPAIVVNFSSDLDLIGLKGVPFATTPEDFARIVRDVLDGKLGNNSEIDHYCFPVGRESASLVIREIEKEKRAGSS